MELAKIAKEFTKGFVAGSSTLIASFKANRTKLHTDFRDLLRKADIDDMDGLLAILNKGMWTDPASAKYHNAFAGGLLDHSMNVYTILKQKVEMYGYDIPERSIIVCALLHDVCKIESYRVVTAWRKDAANKWESYDGYAFNEDSFPMGHGEKSVAMLQEIMCLSKEEQLAIRWHSGPFEEGKNAEFTRAALLYPLVALLHTADFEASTLLESQGTVEWLVKV